MGPRALRSDRSAGDGGGSTAAAEARGTLLRLRPEFSLAWMTESLSMPITGEMAERLRDGLRKAGIPEE